MGLMSSLEKGAKDILVKKVANILSENPEKNVDKIFDLIKKTVKDEENMAKVQSVYDMYNENPAMHEYITNILKDTDKKWLEKFFTNFLANATWYGMPKRAKMLEEDNIKVPYAILMSPSMRCNLRCTGCYAGTYSKKDDISFEELDRIIGEARDLGVYFFVILGGEPFFVDYMMKIYEKYNDCMFATFTNGTLFTEELADKLRSLGNVMPMFSLEGFAEDTDKRRGDGIFNKVMDGMDLLKSRGIPFGVSTAVTTHNCDTVVSDEFIDMLIKKGAKMSWYFIFMPVGINPDVNLMLTPEQRLNLGRRVRKIRTTKPYFAIDFFNDAPYVGGCIAGKYYCHINSKEDVEPCIFAHFATDNVKGKPLLDVFKGDFFRELRERQPYNKNLLRPCMMIDNTEVVRDVVKKCNAHPTDDGAKYMLENEEFKAKLDKLAEDFKVEADKAWKEDFKEQGNYELSKG